MTKPQVYVLYDETDTLHLVNEEAFLKGVLPGKVENPPLVKPNIKAYAEILVAAGYAVVPQREFQALFKLYKICEAKGLLHDLFSAQLGVGKTEKPNGNELPHD